MVGIACVLIASKYEEIYAPEVRDFVYITDKSFTKEEILAMEYKILSTLNFDILSVSTYRFLERFHFVSQDNMKVFHLAQYFLELSLLEYKMLNYKSSLKAASSLYLARKIFKMEPNWNNSLQFHAGFNEKELLPCCKDLLSIADLINKVTLNACTKKFSSAKFNEVSKMVKGKSN